MWSYPVPLYLWAAIAVVAAIYVAICRQALSGDVIGWLLIAVFLVAFVAATQGL